MTEGEFWYLALLVLWSIITGCILGFVGTYLLSFNLAAIEGERKSWAGLMRATLRMVGGVGAALALSVWSMFLWCGVRRGW